MVDHSLLKSGNKVLVENQPYLIIDTDFVNPGKGQAFTKIKIKNLLNKKIIEKTVKIG
jgi:elongation factor P